jgi:hypothetical protein
MSTNKNDKNNRYIFWLDKVSVLYENNNYLQFIPTKNMTRVEQLNAITRFGIYLFALLAIFNKPTSWLYMPVILIILAVIFYNIYKFDPKGAEKELYRIQREKIDRNENIESQDYVEPNKDKEYHLETGYYDSNGKLIVGGDYNRKKKNQNKIDYSLNDLIEYQQQNCRKPTKDNPFMNPPVTDFNDGDVPAACNADDEDIKEKIELNFNNELYRDIEDLFNVKNSQRQFYTVPVTAIPNDQQAFAEWLYKSPATCKEGGNCLRYEDIRFKR